MTETVDPNYEEDKATQAKAAGNDGADSHSGSSETSTDNVGSVTNANPLWQSGSVGTDGSGPNTEDVTHVFDQARADALQAAVTHLDEHGEVPSNVVLPEDTTGPQNNDEAVNNLRSSLEDAKAAVDDKVGLNEENGNEEGAGSEGSEEGTNQA